MSDPTEPKNLLFIMSDEHNKRVAGCYGHPFARTPNLDKLARSGTLFTSAYCNSPICVPARAALATGKYVHETGQWDNAIAYRGKEKSWHHVLRENDVDVASIGKLHFRGGDDYGFTEELLPLHVVDGVGDLQGLLRKNPPQKLGSDDLANDAGPGDSSYNRYDNRIAAKAIEWLNERAVSGAKKPFALFVSFIFPHFPLIAPQEYVAMYEPYSLAELEAGIVAPRDNHPSVNAVRDYMHYDDFFDEQKRVMALRTYFGMVTKLDGLIGQVITSMQDNGFADQTHIVYTSDHGDNLGSHGMWGKSVMYENSAAVPMIVAGPDVPAGHRSDTPVTLIDVAPTALQATGVDSAKENYRGTSLIALANDVNKERVAFSEYHAAGSDTGTFMIKKRNWKLIYYVGEVPQLFDLATDPLETTDLAADADCQGVREELISELRRICDPEKVNDVAFADQKAVIEAHGGRSAIMKSTVIPFTPAPE